MIVNRIDPTLDPRWAELVERHPRASVFHSVGWLQALRHTYAYEPVAFTTSPATSELKNGVVLCRVKSWLTGDRLVSLPFSDHCEPLCDLAEELHFLVCYLQGAADYQQWRYVELRPINNHFGEAIGKTNFSQASQYFVHMLSLNQDLDQLFRSFDKDCVQRRIRRAERAGLVEKCGTCEQLLRDFYRLFVTTRSRHHLPPMPYAWFRNLRQYLGESLEIRLAYKEGIPISGILTLQFKSTVVYKYGCSDAQFKRLGATPWLLWRAIVVAKSRGATQFDMGRTIKENVGLLEFKNHWVPQPNQLTYWTFPGIPFFSSSQGWKMKVANRAFSFMPNVLLKLTGRLLYRHFG